MVVCGQNSHEMKLLTDYIQAFDAKTDTIKILEAFKKNAEMQYFQAIIFLHDDVVYCVRWWP